MAPHLIYRDLFPFGQGSLVWLRLYRSDAGERVALAIDPSDNPGRSAVNGAEGLIDAIRDAFPGGGLRVLLRYPEDRHSTEWIEVSVADRTPEFARLEVAAVEALVGDPLPDPAASTCADLARDDHPLLAMIPSPEPERDPLASLAVVAVADIPWAHNPGACPLHERFESLRATYPDDDRGNPAIGAHWFLTLGEEELASCHYHQADWARIAGVSVEVLEGLEEEATMGDALRTIGESLGDSSESSWCASLFQDPIFFAIGSDQVGNGQHRSCALRASGAELCVVEVEGVLQLPPRAGDPRSRAAAAIAGFWARRAAS